MVIVVTLGPSVVAAPPGPRTPRTEMRTTADSTPSDPYVVDRASTEAFSRDDRTGFWAEHVCRNHGALRFAFDDPAAFRGGTIVQRQGSRQLIEFWSDGIDYDRTTRDVRRDGDESLRLLVPLTGRFRVEQDGSAVAVAPGDAAVVTKARPFSLRQGSAARALILNVAPDADAGGAGRGPVVLGVRDGVGAVIATMLASVASQRDAVDGRQFGLVTDTVCELLMRAVRPPVPAADTLAVVEAAVREHVRLNASDPALTPARVARELGWSVRQVQLALERSGTTPSALLRDTRLELARRRLSDGTSSWTIAQIAYASGFGSLSAFGAAFKRRFGVSPREHRAGRS